MFNSCSKSMSAYCLSKDNEKAYSVMSRIPIVQPKRNWGGGAKQPDKLDFPVVPEYSYRWKIMYVLSIYNKFDFKIYVYQTLQTASFP